MGKNRDGAHLEKKIISSLILDLRALSSVEEIDQNISIIKLLKSNIIIPRYELYLSIAVQLSNLKKWTLIISQFLWVRNLGPASLGVSDTGSLWDCCQDVSWGCSYLKVWLGLEDLLPSSLKWLLPGAFSSSQFFNT